MAGISLLCLVLPCIQPAGPAPTAAAQREEIQRLVRQLGSNRFAQRQAAGRALTAIGEPALAALDRAATTSTDPEVRHRADQILQAIGVRLFSKATQVRRIEWHESGLHGHRIRGFHGMPVHVYYTAFSPDGRSYLAGGDTGPLCLWDVATGKQIREFKGHEGWTCNAVFTPDGNQVLSGGVQDKSLRLWEVASGRALGTFTGHSQEVTTVAIAPGGRLALSGSADRTLRLWDLATGREVRRLEGHADRCGGIFSPDGKQVLSFSADTTLRLWDVATGQLLRTFSGHTAAVAGAFFLPNHPQVLSYASDQTVRVWNLATGKELYQHRVGDDHCMIRWLVVTADGRHFLTNHQDFTIRLRHLGTGRELHRFTVPPQASPQGLSISPDGRYAASGSYRGFVYLFRLADKDR